MDLPLTASDRAVVDGELDGIFPVDERVAGALFDAFVSNPDIDTGYAFERNQYPDVRVRRAVVHDRPSRALCSYSDYAQLVVVARRGRDAFRSLVLGSTSLWLLHHARCPVAVTRTKPGRPFTGNAT